MQPFLLVNLPEFVFDIPNRRTIDANSRCPPIGKRGRKTSHPYVTWCVCMRAEATRDRPRPTLTYKVFQLSSGPRNAAKRTAGGKTPQNDSTVFAGVPRCNRKQHCKWTKYGASRKITNAGEYLT